MAYRTIPTKTHGVLDYLISIVLILLPALFRIGPSDGVAAAVPILLGIIIFLYSLFTYYELGIFKFIAMPRHLVVDAVAGAILVVSPFLLGFAGDGLNAWLPHVVAGLLLIGVVIFTKTAPAGTVTPVG